jgi:hypothetical protein
MLVAAFSHASDAEIRKRLELVHALGEHIDPEHRAVVARLLSCTSPTSKDLQLEMGAQPFVWQSFSALFVDARDRVNKAIGATEDWPKGKPKGRPKIRRASEVEWRETTWLWSGYIALGMLTLIEGDPGNGKSTIALDLAARVTTGRPMPDGSRPTGATPRGVVILSAEDDPECTLRPRLDAAGADCTRVALLEGVDDEDGPRMPNVTDLDAIGEAIECVDAVLVVIDPLSAYMGPRADTHRDADVRSRIAPLIKLCSQRAAALVAVRHLNKALSVVSAIHRGGGSMAFVAAARAAVLVAPDHEDETGTRRIFAPYKNNVAKMPPSMAYHVEAVGHVSRIAWEGASLVGATDLLRAQARAGGDDEASCLDEAKAFLAATLAAGPMRTTDVVREAGGQGIRPRTLRRAHDALGVVARKEAKHWVWQLPAPAEPGDACERPTPNEDGQEEMANALRDAWPPCNSVKAQ